MKLHIFNPEHDIALARNTSNFTAPHAARQLRMDMGFIPALWADNGDYVLVDNADAASEQARHIARRLSNIRFVELADLHSLSDITEVSPWGWDPAITAQLRSAGIDDSLLPSNSSLEMVRQLSSRKLSVDLLPKIGSEEQSWIVSSTDDLEELLRKLQRIVVKAPWSCSGRGVRYITENTLTLQTLNWIRGVLSQQKFITVEPYYNKVVDFGMEFISTQGSVRYSGLSVFSTKNGFYTGNVIASETYKLQALSNYVSKAELSAIRQQLEPMLSDAISSCYNGPLGVDMMVYATPDRKLHVHPMVEINLRRTMGHVALALQRSLKSDSETMRIEYIGNKYKLKITTNQSEK